MTHSGPFDRWYEVSEFVLIPLLLDDPLWESKIMLLSPLVFVLIPLLLDDPLWVVWIGKEDGKIILSLNPSFAG